MEILMSHGDSPLAAGATVELADGGILGDTEGGDLVGPVPVLLRRAPRISPRGPIVGRTRHRARATTHRNRPARRVDGGAGWLGLGESLQLSEPMRVSGVRHRTGKTVTASVPRSSLPRSRLPIRDRRIARDRTGLVFGCRRRALMLLTPKGSQHIGRGQ
jgi:hypothetical protein